MIGLTLEIAKDIQNKEASAGNFFNIKRESHTGKFYLTPVSYLGFIAGYPTIAPSVFRVKSLWESILND